MRRWWSVDMRARAGIRGRAWPPGNRSNFSSSFYSALPTPLPLLLSLFIRVSTEGIPLSPSLSTRQGRHLLFFAFLVLIANMLLDYPGASTAKACRCG